MPALQPIERVVDLPPLTQSRSLRDEFTDTNRFCLSARFSSDVLESLPDFAEMRSIKARVAETRGKKAFDSRLASIDALPLKDAARLILQLTEPDHAHVFDLTCIYDTILLVIEGRLYVFLWNCTSCHRWHVTCCSPDEIRLFPTDSHSVWLITA